MIYWTPVELVHPSFHPQRTALLAEKPTGARNLRSPESTECLARVCSVETVLGVGNVHGDITGHTRKESV